jgi:cell shape-determining protein MreC
MAKKSIKIVEAEVVSDLRNVNADLKNVKIPSDLKERFDPQIDKVCQRLVKITDGMQKAVENMVSQTAKNAVKRERKTAKIARAKAQLEKIQAYLESIE